MKELERALMEGTTGTAEMGTLAVCFAMRHHHIMDLGDGEVSMVNICRLRIRKRWRRPEN